MSGVNRGAGRVGVIVVLIVSLVAAGFTRQIAELQHRRASQVAGSSGAGGESTSLAGMSSFALALLLGGLRGPLVMILWTSSENQKNEKNLEDFDTKIEWIRRLQPEFDTVHIFQIWNKAYNISVQMATLQNKYLTILDALDYAFSVDRERPNNINIITSIAQVDFDKLGNSAEKAYYRKRIREESLPHQPKQKLARNDPGWRRLEMDPILDSNHNILPQLLVPQGAQPAALPYLKQYEPFNYGVSPFALAYNYYKRGQQLQRVDKQKHAQMSDLVIDSRPALSLKNWAEEEWERGRRAELDAYDKSMPVAAERVELELPTAAIPMPDHGKPDQVAAALDAYSLSARLCRDAIAEYDDHLKIYRTNFDTYQSHLAGLTAQEHLVTADHDFLAAANSTAAIDSPDRKKLLDNARAQYEAAAREYLLIILRYYVDPMLAKAIYPEKTRDGIEKLPTEVLAQTLNNVHQFYASKRAVDTNREDREEYERYIARCAQRLATLGQ